MKKRIITIGICLFLLLVSLNCFAEGNQDFIFTVGSDPQSFELIDFKMQLYEYGFYGNSIQSNTLQDETLDVMTLSAVKTVCSMNEGLNYYSNGVTFDVWWRVMGMDGRYDTLHTPIGDVFFCRDMAFNIESEAVNRLRERLIELDYGKCGIELNETGPLDQNVVDALALFAKCNNTEFDQSASTVTAAMQNLVFSDAAVPADASVRLKFPQNLFFSMKQNGDVFGLKMPNYVIWGVGLVLLGVIVFLCIKLCAPRKIPESRKGTLEFDIEYNGNKSVYRSNPYEYIRIGRATGNFPLDVGDKYISRKHCEIYHENGDVMLRDFSLYGTMVNNKKCTHGSQILHDGDTLMVGKHRITIHIKK